MYFANKFDKEFLYLCNQQEPKGGKVRLDDSEHTFWIFKTPPNTRKTGGIKNRPTRKEVIPLLLFNKITSNNDEDISLEDYMMLCENKSDTVVTCEYDPNYVTQQVEDNFICNFGITNTTGDLEDVEITEGVLLDNVTSKP